MFRMSQAVKVKTGKYEGLAGIVREIRQDEKTKKPKYRLEIEGVQNSVPVKAMYWCEEANGERI